MKALAALAIACIVMLSTVGQARATVTVAPMAPGVTNQFVNGKWRITIERFPVFQEVYTIEGDAGDNIEYIRVTNNNSSPLSEVRLLIRAVSGTPGLNNIDEIDRAGPGLVWIVQLNINGDFGRQAGGSTNVLRVNRLQNVVIGGHMYATTYINDLPNGAEIFLRDMRIQGDLRNHIFGDTAPIESIRVDGDIRGIPQRRTAPFRRDRSRRPGRTRSTVFTIRN